MTTQAQNLIQQLHNQGLNNSQIAKLVGRDSSQISQIEKGKRTGDVLVPALSRIVAGEQKEAVTAPRQQTKTGKQKKVRTGAIRDTKNRIINETSNTPNGLKLRSDLKTIEKNRGLIGVVVSYRKYQAYEDVSPSARDVPLWSKGTTAKWINAKLSTGITFTELLQEQVENAYNPTFAEGIIGVQINVIYPHDK